MNVDVEAAAAEHVRAAQTFLDSGARDEALAQLEAGRELVEDRGPSPAKALVLQELARVLLADEQFDRALEVGVEALRVADRVGVDPARSRNLNTVGVARIMQGDPRGLDDLERAAAIVAGAGTDEELAAVANLAWMTVLLGNVRRAGEAHERALQLAERIGVGGALEWQRGEHALHCHWEGRWDEAAAAAEEFLRDVETAEFMAMACRCVSGSIALARGDAEAGLADAARAVEVARRAGDAHSLPPALAFEARAKLAVEDRRGATDLVEELLAAWQRSGVRTPHEAVDAAWVFTDLERPDDFVEALKRAGYQTPWHDAARRIATGDFLTAAETYHRIGSVPDEAYARLRAAEAFVDKGRRADADAQLKLARPVFAQLRATAWAERGEELLAVS